MTKFKDQIISLCFENIFENFSRFICKNILNSKRNAKNDFVLICFGKDERYMLKINKFIKCNFLDKIVG